MPASAHAPGSSDGRWSVLLLSRVLMVLGLLIAILSLIVPVVHFFITHPWLITLALGVCLLGLGAALAIAEDGFVGLLGSKCLTDVSPLDAAIYIRELNRTACDPKRHLNPTVSVSKEAPPRLLQAIAWLHQLSHLAALCLVHPDDDEIQDLIADSDVEFFEFSCNPLVAVLPPNLQRMLVGRAGVARVAAKQARYAQEPVPSAACAAAGGTAHEDVTGSAAGGEAASEPAPAGASSEGVLPPSTVHDELTMRADKLMMVIDSDDPSDGGQTMAVRRRRRQLQHEACYEQASLQTPRTRSSMIHRLSQRRLSVTNQRRVIIYGKLALMPLRMALAQLQPIVPYATASLKDTRIYAWAASWASYVYAMAGGIVGQVRGRAGSVVAMAGGK